MNTIQVTTLVIGLLIILSHVLILSTGKIVRFGNFCITSKKRLQSFLDVHVTAKDPYKIAKSKAKGYYKGRLSTSFLGLVTYSNKKVESAFNSGVNENNVHVTSREGKLAKKFKGKWKVEYHWEHGETEDGMKVKGTSTGEIHADNRANAQKVANTHGWESTKKHIIEQGQDVLTDIILVKAVITPLKK